MKYSVSIRFEVDPILYHQVKNKPGDIFKLAKAMVERRADFPPMDDISISVATKLPLESTNKN